MPADPEAADVEIQDEGPGVFARLQQVDEVRYLATDNTPLYRAIVAFLYERYESSEMGWVWPSEIVSFLRDSGMAAGAYDERVCVQHLTQLEKWRVVTSEHDLESVRTLQEFVSQARRYQITERGRLVEEFARQLEADDSTRGSLEVGRIRRLREALVAIDALLKQHASFSHSLFAEWKRGGLTERLAAALVEVERNRKVDRREPELLAEIYRGRQLRDPLRPPAGACLAARGTRRAPERENPRLRALGPHRGRGRQVDDGRVRTSGGVLDVAQGAARR